MNKSTHVIFLGAFTLAFGFIACSAAEDIENSATAGHTSTAGSPAAGSTATGTGGTGSAGHASAGAPATSSAGRPATSSGGSSTIDPSTSSSPSSSTSNGCSLGLRAASNGALGGIALALALALVARRRVKKPNDSC